MFGVLDCLAADRRASDAQEAAWLQNVAAYDRSGEWAVDGYLNAASALRHRCRMNHGVARGHVELARKLQQLAAVAEAVGDGDISCSHALVVAAASTSEEDTYLVKIQPQLVFPPLRH